MMLYFFLCLLVGKATGAYLFYPDGTPMPATSVILATIPTLHDEYYISYRIKPATCLHATDGPEAYSPFFLSNYSGQYGQWIGHIMLLASKFFIYVGKDGSFAATIFKQCAFLPYEWNNVIFIRRKFDAEFHITVAINQHVYLQETTTVSDSAANEDIHINYFRSDPRGAMIRDIVVIEQGHIEAGGYYGTAEQELSAGRLYRAMVVVNFNGLTDAQMEIFVVEDGQSEPSDLFVISDKILEKFPDEVKLNKSSYAAHNTLIQKQTKIWDDFLPETYVMPFKVGDITESEQLVWAVTNVESDEGMTLTAKPMNLKRVDETCDLVESVWYIFKQGELTVGFGVEPAADCSTNTEDVVLHMYQPKPLSLLSHWAHHEYLQPTQSQTHENMLTLKYATLKIGVKIIHYVRYALPDAMPYNYFSTRIDLNFKVRGVPHTKTFTKPIMSIQKDLRDMWRKIEESKLGEKEDPPKHPHLVSGGFFVTCYHFIRRPKPDCFKIDPKKGIFKRFTKRGSVLLANGYSILLSAKNGAPLRTKGQPISDEKWASMPTELTLPLTAYAENSIVTGMSSDTQTFTLSSTGLKEKGKYVLNLEE